MDKFSSGDAPLVTLYLPTRGRPALLMRALESAFRQTYSNLEIVVVIDGPDPETHAILSGYRDCPRLRVLQRTSSGGACVARNEAIAAATGELITGLDDDDELEPGHVEALVSALIRSSAAFVATTALTIRTEGKLVRHAFTGPITLDALLSENVVGNQVLTQTNHLRQVGAFDPEMPAWQDYDLWVRLAMRFGPGFKVDTRTYIQHQNHGGERISARDRIHAAHQKFTTKHARLLTPLHRASLELLVLATTHEPFSIRRLFGFARAGLHRRALVAYVANRAPALRHAFLALRARE